MISVYFLNVDYIIDTEIPYAIEKGKRIISIIIKPCDWYSMPLSTIKGEPTSSLGELNAQNKAAVITLRPEFNLRDEKGNLQIKEFTETERDQMWLKVVNDLRIKIEKD